MNWSATIPVIASITVVAITVPWLRREWERSFRADPETKNGQKVAQPSSTQLFFVWLILAIAVVVAVAACGIAIVQGEKFDEPIALIFLISVIWFPAYWVVRAMTRWYLWDEKVLISGGFFVSRRMFAWSNLKSADWSNYWQCYIFDFGDDGRLWVQKMGAGTGALIEDAQRHLKSASDLYS